MLRLAFDFIITWRETRTRPNAYFRFNTRKLSDSDRFRLLLQYLDIGDYKYAG